MYMYMQYIYIHRLSAIVHAIMMYMCAVNAHCDVSMPTHNGVNTCTYTCIILMLRLSNPVYQGEMPFALYKL